MCPHTCVTNMPKPRQKQPGWIYWCLLYNISNITLILFFGVCAVSFMTDFYQMCCCIDDSHCLIFFSGCWSSFYAGRQLGGREADCSGYRQRAGCGGGSGSDPKGSIWHTEHKPHFDQTDSLNRRGISQHGVRKLACPQFNLYYCV